MGVFIVVSFINMSDSENNRNDEVVIDDGDDFDWISIDPGESRDEFDVPFAFLPESERNRTLSNAQLGDDSNNYDAYSPKKRVYREVPHRARVEADSVESGSFFESTTGVILMTSMALMGAIGVYMWTQRR